MNGEQQKTGAMHDSYSSYQSNLMLRNQIDKNISRILDSSDQSFSLLYNHPKLINQVFNPKRNMPGGTLTFKKNQKQLLITSQQKPSGLTFSPGSSLNNSPSKKSVFPKYEQKSESFSTNPKGSRNNLQGHHKREGSSSTMTN